MYYLHERVIYSKPAKTKFNLFLFSEWRQWISVMSTVQNIAQKQFFSFVVFVLIYPSKVTKLEYLLNGSCTVFIYLKNKTIITSKISYRFHEKVKIFIFLKMKIWRLFYLPFGSVICSIQRNESPLSGGGGRAESNCDTIADFSVTRYIHNI